MEIPKPAEVDRARFHSLVPDDDRVETRPMFGNLGGFVNGNMFMGLFGADIGLKLADREREELRQAGGGQFGPRERPMTGYVTLPTAMGTADAQRWVAASLAYVGALPPKKAKTKR